MVQGSWFQGEAVGTCVWLWGPCSFRSESLLFILFVEEHLGFILHHIRVWPAQGLEDKECEIGISPHSCGSETWRCH